jgi:predicted DNA-binding helix-hairpin-helix protein
MDHQMHSLSLLSGFMDLEPSGDLNTKLDQKQMNAVSITNAQLPNGKQISLLKTMITSVCEKNCNYCPFHSNRNYHRTTLTSEEMAKTFIALHRSGVVKGLFLSSGIAGGGIRSMDRLIDCADLLRNKYQFRGYLHLKILPGCEKAQVERIMELADRVSINLEAPNANYLRLLAPEKSFSNELIPPLQWVNQIRNERPITNYRNKKQPSLVTQFVVGAVKDSDIDVLKTTAQLHTDFKISRAYFSIFTPIPDTPFENHPPVPRSRKYRLYQASFLIRDYGFDITDLHFDNKGNLDTELDPKMYWANSHLQNNPIEINTAQKEELLRVPGIGQKAVQSILIHRRTIRFQSIQDLYKIGIKTTKPLPYIMLNGKRPIYQQKLF